MDTKKRRLEILELLDERGNIRVTDLSLIFDVSEMTVRRDLEFLEKEGSIKRVRGGAVTAVSRSYEPPFALRAARNVEAKAKIGRVAAAQVSEGDTVILDVGTTTLAVAEALKDRRNITVVTSSLRIAWLLADKPDLRVIVVGGAVRTGERSLVGSIASRTFEDFYCDLMFMGVGGIDLEAGFTEFNIEDATVKQKAMKQSQRVMVVANSSKLGKIAFARVAGVDEVDALITDTETEKVSGLRNAGLEVIVSKGEE